MTKTFPDLRTFLDALRARRDLVEITAEVDPRLEAAEIHRRVIAAGGPAILFRNLKGHRWPTVTNLFGTRERVELAFGKHARETIAQVASLPKELVPPTLGKLWSKRKLFADLARVGLRRDSGGPVTDRCDSPPGLGRLPLLTTWEEDGGPFITQPLVYTESPNGHGPNLGMYRIQRFDDAECGFHVQIGKGGGFHLAEAEALGQRLPVHIFLGGPPALLVSAIAPLPENVPEMLLASLILGDRVPLAKDPTSKLPLPVECEFVLSGHVPPGVRRPEGPFGDHYGYYSLKHDYPVFRCERLWRRDDPILPATVVGKPRQEDFFIGDWLQELLSPLFPVVMPAVSDLWSYGETGYHALSAAVVKQRYKREAMASGFRILGEGQLSLTKFLLVLDKPVDLRDARAVLEHVLERADFRTDLYVFGNLSMDTLDYAGPKVNEGSKGVLLGVGDPIRRLPDAFTGSPPPEVRSVKVACRGALAVEGPAFASDPTFAKTVAMHPAFADWPLVVLCDHAGRATASMAAFLWTAFTRFEPAADLHAKDVNLVRLHPSFTAPIVLDARMKPHYPAELFCDPKTADTVGKRWKEYFPKGLPMGDSDRAHLG